MTMDRDDERDQEDPRLPEDDPNQQRGPGEDDEPELDNQLDREAGTEDDLDGQADESDQVLSQRPARRSREDNFAALREAQRLETERANRFEREATELRQRQYQFEQNQNQRSEQERVALMTTEERVAYELQKARQEFTFATQKMQFDNACAQDKAQYEAKINTGKRATLAPQVEQMFHQQIQQGRYFPRDEIYKYLRGQELDAQEAGQKTKTVSAGAQRQRVAAPNNRSDQTARPRAGRSQSMDDRERRLENLKF